MSVSPASTVMDSSQSEAEDERNIEPTKEAQQRSKSRSRSRSQDSGAPWSWPEDDSQGLFGSHFQLNDPWQPTGVVEKPRVTYIARAGPHDKSPQCPSSSAPARQMRRSPFGGSFMSQIVMDAVYQELGLSKLGHHSAAVEDSVAAMPADLGQAARQVLDKVRPGMGITFLGSPANLVDHASSQIADCVARRLEFYVGITERPVDRFEDHRASKYTRMRLYMLADSQESGDYEIALLRKWRQHYLCQNVAAGGQRRSAGKPHFLYITLKE